MPIQSFDKQIITDFAIKFFRLNGVFESCKGIISCFFDFCEDFESYLLLNFNNSGLNVVIVVRAFGIIRVLGKFLFKYFVNI